MKTTVRWEVQVEKAFTRPVVEGIAKMVVMMRPYDNAITSRELRSTAMDTRKSTSCLTRVSLHDSLNSGEASQKKWLMMLGPQKVCRHRNRMGKAGVRKPVNQQQTASRAHTLLVMMAWYRSALQMAA
ncbi:hypothetical protein NDU88_000149 [Pleurodeles waltl]|uniref:Uncharacterized protein n=1 Tax=Pleurodeles waltl TaxID=8319 RepID=A0AAV7SVT2_PLEWA|nr:hypothetical protein NDU88_000149 [Pleurodeles waltl]